MSKASSDNHSTSVWKIKVDVRTIVSLVLLISTIETFQSVCTKSILQQCNTLYPDKTLGLCLSKRRTHYLRALVLFSKHMVFLQKQRCIKYKQIYCLRLSYSVENVDCQCSEIHISPFCSAIFPLMCSHTVLPNLLVQLQTVEKGSAVGLMIDIHYLSMLDMIKMNG